MSVSSFDIRLPLFAKELTEIAARRRTYVVRVLYALALFVVGVAVLAEQLVRSASGPLQLLGSGQIIFEAMVFTQFLGIYLLLPATTCAVLTLEKERNTLGLLLLTKLGPWTILSEKLLGRLIPMFTLVLLALPLLAFAYSLGGITGDFLCSAIWLMLVASLQVAALAVMCSAWFRTTIGAFLGTYVIGFIVCLGIPTLEELRVIPAASNYVEFMFVPAIFMRASGTSFIESLTASVRILASATVFLCLARLFIVRRAFVPSGNVLISLLEPVDRFLERLLNRISAGRWQLHSADDLPSERPVAWRETAKTFLGTFRYQVYISGAVTLLVLLSIVMIAIDGGRNEEGLAAIYCLFLGFVTLLVCVKSASLFACERSHQTLDILLTTPLTNRQLVFQKFSTVFRLMRVFAIPFLVLVLFETYWTHTHSRIRMSLSLPTDPLLRFVAHVTTVVIYLPMLAWLSLLCGLRIRNQVRAVCVALAAVIAWAILPGLGLVLIFILTNPAEPWGIMFLSSPLTFLALCVSSETRMFDWPLGVLLIVNSLIYGSALVSLRWLCLSKLDRHLQRADANPWPLSVPAPGRRVEFP